MSRIREAHGVTVTGELKFELQKRYYLTGLEVKGACPCCQTPFTVDGGSHYLSYAIPGEHASVYFLCPNCEEGLKITLKLVLDIEVCSGVAVQ